MVAQNAPTGQAQTPPTPVETTRTDALNRPFYVRIHITPSILHAGRWNISCNHPLPLVSEIASRLPNAMQRHITDYGYGSYIIDQVLEQLIGSGHVNVNQLQQALLDYYFNLFSTATNPVEPIEATAFNTPAYLCVAGTIYQLQPTAHTKTNAALKALRRRVYAEATKQADKIIAGARANAAALEEAAATRLREADHALDLAKCITKVTPPAWALSAGIPVKFAHIDSSDYWCVGLYVTISVSQIEYSHHRLCKDKKNHEYVCKRWNLARNAQPYLLWIRLSDAEGHYNQTATCLDKNYSNLPHISHSKACMGLGDAPNRIASPADLARFRDSITRAMSVANFNSLLSYYTTWSKSLQDVIPEKVFKVISSEYWENGLTQLPGDTETILENTDDTFRTSAA